MSYRQTIGKFGPIMNASAWLGKKKYTLTSLFDKLNVEDGSKTQRTAVIIRRESGKYIAALTSGDFQGTVKWQGYLLGKFMGWYQDTGMGYRYPYDRIEVLDIVGEVDGKLVALKGIDLDTVVTPYVFK